MKFAYRRACPASAGAGSLPPAMTALLAAVFAIVELVFPSGAPADDWTFYTESNFILDIAADPGGVWAATPGGALRYAPDGTLLEHLTRADELPANVLQAVAVDATGDVWLGTIGSGAARRRTNDGSVWEYGIADGLHTGIVTTIEPVAGGVWIGTTGGVVKFLGDSRVAEGRNRYNATSGLAADSVLSVVEYGGSTWFGTSQALSEYDPDLGFIHHLSGERINVLRTDAGGNLLAGTATGVYRWNTTSWETLRTGLPATGVRDLAVAGDTLWAAVASPVGVMRFDAGTWVAANGGLLTPGVTDGWASGLALDYDPAAGLWVGTESGLARRVDTTWVRTTTPGPASNSIISLAEDREGGLWFMTGTDNNLFNYGSEPWVGPKGVTRFHEGAWQTYRAAPGGLTSNYAYRAAAVSPGEMWIGTWGGGISRLDIGTGTFTTFRGNGGINQGSDYIPDMADDGQGNLWVGAYTVGASSGMAVYTGGTWVKYIPGAGLPGAEAYGFLRSIAARGNIVWVGTYGIDVAGLGIARIDTRGTPQNIADDAVTVFNPILATWGPVGGTVNDLLIDPDGTLWAGTSSGIAHYNGTSWNTWSGDDGGHGFGEVRGIARDHAGNHWFATRNGLSRLSADGTTWKTFTAQTSLLPLDDVMAVMVEQTSGDVLLATWGAGVARIHVTSPATSVTETEDLVVGPNPFRPLVDGAMSFPDLDPGASIKIFSLGGELLREIPREAVKSWDGRDSGGRQMAAGLYIIVGEEPGGAVRRATIALEH